MVLSDSLSVEFFVHWRDLAVFLFVSALAGWATTTFCLWIRWTLLQESGPPPLCRPQQVSRKKTPKKKQPQNVLYLESFIFQQKMIFNRLSHSVSLTKLKSESKINHCCSQIPRRRIVVWRKENVTFSIFFHFYTPTINFFSNFPIYSLNSRALLYFSYVF